MEKVVVCHRLGSIVLKSLTLGGLGKCGACNSFWGWEFLELQGCERFLIRKTVAAASQKRPSTMDQFSLNSCAAICTGGGGGGDLIKKGRGGGLLGTCLALLLD